MTAAMWPCKGTIIKLSISSTLVAVAQMTECSPPGAKSLDYEAKTFDQSGVGVPRNLNGFSDGGEFSATFWWDPTLATHQAILALINGVGFSPVTPQKGSWVIDLTPSTTPNTISFTTAGLEIGPKLDMDKALACEVKGNLDGLPVVA